MAKTQSLASQNEGTLQESAVNPLTLPSVFQQASEPLKSQSWAPYVTFAHSNKKDEWQKIQSKTGVPNEGDMYFIDNDTVVHLPKAKLGWLVGKQVWVQANAGGEVQVATFVEAPFPFREQVESVVLVYLDDRIVPANMTFKTTKCRAAVEMSKALAEASDNKWADKSAAHRETLVSPQPFMRFYAEVVSDPPKPSKSSGMTYRTTSATIKPTSIQEWRLLKALCDNIETSKALEAAAARYQQRLKDLEAKVLKK